MKMENNNKNIKSIKWLIFLTFTIIILIITKKVLDQDIMKIDLIGYNFISKYLIHPKLTSIIKMITNIGSAFSLITITIVLLIVIKDKLVSYSILGNLIIITFFNQMLKLTLQRPRPTDFRLINETGYSFPSGHSMVNTAFYGYLIYIIYKRIKNKYLKWSLIILLSILIITIGISRIYLGVHYTSDVVAGFLISICYLIIYTGLINKLIDRSSKWKIRN